MLGTIQLHCESLQIQSEKATKTEQTSTLGFARMFSEARAQRNPDETFMDRETLYDDQSGRWSNEIESSKTESRTDFNNFSRRTSVRLS